MRKHPSEANHYEILAGERRWRAAQAAQLHEVPVILRDTDDRGASEIALIENVQRQDLNLDRRGRRPVAVLIEEFDHTQDWASAAPSAKPQPHRQHERGSVLPDEVVSDDRRWPLSAAARATTARDPLKLAQEIVRDGLSVRQIEASLRADRAGPDGVAPVEKVKVKDANVTPGSNAN